MKNNYKNVYVIDMDKVLANQDKYVIYGNSALPIKKRNDVIISKPEHITGCSLSSIETMVAKFRKLSKKIGETAASTVVQYLDETGTPVVTLYPTGETDLLNNKWSHFAWEAQQDLFKMQKQISEKAL